MLAGKGLDLLGLITDNLCSIGEVVIDKFLVGLVDKGSKEEDRGGNEGQSPEWYNLDQVVREEGTQESLYYISTMMSETRIGTYSG